MRSGFRSSSSPGRLSTIASTRTLSRVAKLAINRRVKFQGQALCLYGTGFEAPGPSSLGCVTIGCAYLKHRVIEALDLGALPQLSKLDIVGERIHDFTRNLRSAFGHNPAIPSSFSWP